MLLHPHPLATNNKQKKKRMRQLLYSIRHQALTVALAAATTAGITSCNTVWDNDDCGTEYRVKFKYDYNMLFTDAFSTQVPSVTLYAFDSQDRLVFKKSESGELLAADDYYMTLDVDPGQYRLVAWAGLSEEDNSYEVPELTVGQHTLTDLQCRINRYPHQAHGGQQVDSVGQLAALWHGVVPAQTVTRANTYSTEYVTVPLVKNTHTLRIILQQMAEGQMNATDFEISVTDQNGLMLHDNSLAEEDGTLTYLAYHQTQGTTAVEGEGNGLNVVVAELSTGRLMADADTRLTISNRRDGTPILSIPLIQYLELCRTVANYDMPLQEYLDREDSYSMTFFLNSNNAWLNTQIIINNWIVRYNDITPEF